MIQDIAPAQFSVSYDLREPRAESVICAIQGHHILGSLSDAGELTLPKFCELTVSAEDCWFLFSISGRDYFWCRKELRPCGGAE